MLYPKVVLKEASEPCACGAECPGIVLKGRTEKMKNELN